MELTLSQLIRCTTSTYTRHDGKTVNLYWSENLYVFSIMKFQIFLLD